MKIAFLSRYFGKSDRGVEVYVKELTQRLKVIGHAVSIHKDISDHVDPTTEVVISTNGRWDVLQAKIWTVRHKAKLVVVGQSGPGIDDRLNLWAFPDTFIGLTKHQTEWAKKVNPFVQTATIPNGVDLEKFDSSNKGIDFGLPGPVVLAVAALVPIKRLDLLIKAVSKTQASLVLIGKGSEHQKLSELGTKLLANRFSIMSLSHDEIPKAYASADIFAFPTSPWESFGIVLVEAMSAGLGVVTTNDPIRREIVGDAGMFIDPTDTDMFAAALEKALAKKWGTAPRKQAEKFSWDAIAAQYDQVLKALNGRNEISVAIIATHKSEILPECLESAKKISDDVVIVTNEDHEFTDYASQKNYVNSLCKNTWILSLDADEWLSDELILEIQDTLPNTKYDGFKIPRQNYIFGKAISYSNWGPQDDTHIWLFKKAKGKWEGKVHEEVVVKGQVGNLQNYKMHQNYTTVEQFVSKMNKYSSLETHGQNPMYDFLRRYIWHLGFLDGWHGLFLCYLQAIYHTAVQIKLWEKKN